MSSKFIHFLGPPGAGKTTLILTLTSLFPLLECNTITRDYFNLPEDKIYLIESPGIFKKLNTSLIDREAIQVLLSAPIKVLESRILNRHDRNQEEKQLEILAISHLVNQNFPMLNNLDYIIDTSNLVEIDSLVDILSDEILSVLWEI
jgi:Ni2+-binding GTPase involved in maturation of urease and hydrogenase